jgi:hypothetical protein
LGVLFSVFVDRYPMALSAKTEQRKPDPIGRGHRMPPIEPVKNTVLIGADIPMVTPLENVVERGGDTPHEAPAKPRASGKSEKSKQKPSSSSRLLSILVMLVTAVSLCAAVVGSYKLLGMAHSYVAAQDRFLVGVHDIELTPFPAWIRCDLLAEVQRLGNLPNHLNTMDDGLSCVLRDAFSMHPWVREVIEVRVKRPSQIRVKLTYREPIAAVHTTRSLETVDRDAVLLPNEGLPDPQSYLTITGVRSTPSGPAGTKWDDAALAAGIAVADALSAQHSTLGITTIDVNSFRPGNANPGAIFLLTEHGTRVKWGRPPDAKYPGEIPLQDKIDRLEKYVSDHGSLDAPAGPYDIDITHWQEISLRPRNQGPTRNR